MENETSEWTNERAKKRNEWNESKQNDKNEQTGGRKNIRKQVSPVFYVSFLTLADVSEAHAPVKPAGV